MVYLNNLFSCFLIHISLSFSRGRIPPWQKVSEATIRVLKDSILPHVPEVTSVTPKTFDLLVDKAESYFSGIVEKNESNGYQFQKEVEEADVCADELKYLEDEDAPDLDNLNRRLCSSQR